MKVEVLHFEGCPNVTPTLELIRDVSTSLGVGVEIAHIEVRSVEEAIRTRFLGSPTVRVDGRDLDPAARSRTDFTLGCRLYGASGVPPRDMIERALIKRGSA